MYHVIFFDDEHWYSLLPLSFTKPACELRIGIRTITEKWTSIFQGSHSYITREYLSKKYPININQENLIINGRLLPNDQTVHLIKQLEINQALIFNDVMIAARLDDDQINRLGDENQADTFKAIDVSSLAANYVKMITRPYDLFSHNKEQIAYDFKQITNNRRSLTLAKNNRTLNPEQIFVEEGANVNFSILNASEGPIYIGKNAQVLENAIIKGPFALGDSGVVKMGAKIYSGVSTGPHCKIGGEISNTVIQGYSNKGHDGYLGDSVLGEWCNLGADTNNSNLKNNYAEVKAWNYKTERFDKSGLQFCGLTMGDHSKSAINTMFNTGTVTGVAANVFGHGFPRNFIPSYSWGGYQKLTTFTFDKSLEMMDLMMSRRNVTLSEEDIQIMKTIFDHTAKYRSWEKT